MKLFTLVLLQDFLLSTGAVLFFKWITWPASLASNRLVEFQAQ